MIVSTVTDAPSAAFRSRVMAEIVLELVGTPALAGGAHRIPMIPLTLIHAPRVAAPTNAARTAAMVVAEHVALIRGAIVGNVLTILHAPRIAAPTNAARTAAMAVAEHVALIRRATMGDVSLHAYGVAQITIPAAGTAAEGAAVRAGVDRAV